MLPVPPLSFPQPAPAPSGNIPNATVTSRRGNVVINHSIRVNVLPVKPENMTQDGVRVSTTIMAEPGTQWHTGDRVTFESLDGFTDLDQTTIKEVMSAGREPSAQGVGSLIRVFLRGTIQ